MTHDQWLTLLAPIMSAFVLGVAGVLGAVMTGLTGRLNTYLTARGNAAAAQAVAAASAVIQPALMTGASTIAGKIARGEMDYTDRDAWGAEAAREVALVQERVPGMIAVASAQTGPMIASMMAKVDQQIVASAGVADPLPAKGVL